MGRGLSKLQLAILRCIRDLEEVYGDTGGFAPWQNGWNARRNGNPYTRAEQASISRAVRRLEKRGLVDTRRTIDGNRNIIGVRLTEQGRLLVNNPKNQLVNH